MVLYDKKFSTKLKGKLYLVVIRPALLNGIKYWPIMKTFKHKMDVAEMRMMGWMCGHSKMDRIWNQELRRVSRLLLCRQKCVKRG